MLLCPNASVEVEKYIGRQTDSEGGRIDIYFTDGKHSIIIENKIYAGDQHHQMLEENMDVSKRKPEIQKLFDIAWHEVAEKNREAAKDTATELEAKTPSDQIELIQLRAIINRIELIGK